MLGLLREQESLWQRLQATTKPIYLYGMGNGAEKVIAALERYGLRPHGIFASDEFVRGHSFAGMPVQRYSDVKAAHGHDFISLLCFGVDYEPLLSRLHEMDLECEFYAPDVPVIPKDDSLFDLSFLSAHEGELDEVYSRLADEASRQVFRGLLDYKLSGRLCYLDEITTEKSDVFTQILRPVHNGVYVDLGAFNGDTIREYLAYMPCCGQIVAMEPDPKNYSRLCAGLAEQDIPYKTYPYAAWCREETLYFKGGRGGRNSMLSRAGKLPVQAVPLDQLLAGSRADVIKLDVEGAESEALAGAKQTITNYAPQLIVSGYHCPDDLFALPLQVLSYRSDYQMYLRKHPYIPAWDVNFYFV